MAILQNVEVTVEVGGQSLEEYNDDDDVEQGQHAASKFIEAVSNAKFAIGAKVCNNFKFITDGLEFHIYLEGQRAAGMLLGEKKATRREGITCGQTILEDKDWKLRPFQFVDAKIVANPVSATMMTQMLLHAEKQGIIIVKVFSVAISGEIPYRNYKELGEQAVVKKVQSKNALTHSTTTGKSQKAARALCYRTSYNADCPPLATFKFKYRSRDALKALHVLPRTPSPVPLEERPIEDLTFEELRDLMRRQSASNQIKKEHEEAAKNIKRERDDEVDEILASARVNKVKKAKQNPSRKGEIVDLSD